MYFNSCI